MQVFHAAGVPPRSGNTILATIGSTRKSNVALTNSVMAKRKGKRGSPQRFASYFDQSIIVKGMAGFGDVKMVAHSCEPARLATNLRRARQTKTDRPPRFGAAPL